MSLPPVDSPIWSILKETIRTGSVIFVGVFFYDQIVLDKDLRALLVVSLTSGGLAGATQLARKYAKAKDGKEDA